MQKTSDIICFFGYLIGDKLFLCVDMGIKLISSTAVQIYGALEWQSIVGSASYYLVNHLAVAGSHVYRFIVSQAECTSPADSLFKSPYNIQESLGPSGRTTGKI